MRKLSTTFHQWRRPRDDRGATAVEYGLMVGLIAAVIIAAVTAFGIAVDGLFFIPAGVFN
jgi:pilus assembly protein Flp/PilA